MKTTNFTRHSTHPAVRPASIILSIVVSAATSLGQLSAANLVVNGDFEQGNTGFATQYAYTPSGGTPVLSAGVYNVGTNPGVWASDFTVVNSYGDHTTGSGLMLMCNGATNANTLAWGETASVTPNTNYTFSAWVSSVDFFLPATLNFDLNGGTPISFAAPSNGGVWQQFSTTVNSGNSTSMAMQVFDTNLSGGGNDFALDDISLTANPVPEPGTIVLTAISATGLAGYALRRRWNARRLSALLHSTNRARSGTTPN